MTKKKTPLGGQASLPFPEDPSDRYWERLPCTAPTSSRTLHQASLPFPEGSGASEASALPERGSGGGDEGEKGSPVKGAEKANTSDELTFILTIEGNGHEAAALLEQAGVEVKSLRRAGQGNVFLGTFGSDVLLDFVKSIAAEGREDDGRCSECDEPWEAPDPEYQCCIGQQATMILLQLDGLAAPRGPCQTCGERVAFAGALTCSEECDRIRISREGEEGG